MPWPARPEDKDGMRICSVCERVLPATTEYFHRQQDRLRRVCKACVKEQSRLRYQEKRERILAQSKRYYESHREAACERQRRWRDANRDYFRARTRAYAERTRVVRLAHQRVWRAEHPDKQREYHRRYRQRHPGQHLANEHNRRARLRGADGSHTAADVRAQYARQKGRCYWCGKKVGTDYHVDHVIPLALGGSNGPENLVVACPSCNMHKHTQHPMDFAGRLF